MISEEERFDHQIFSRHIFDVIFNTQTVLDTKYSSISEIPFVGIDKIKTKIDYIGNLKCLTFPCNIENEKEQMKSFFNKHCKEGEKVTDK